VTGHLVAQQLADGLAHLGAVADQLFGREAGGHGLHGFLRGGDDDAVGRDVGAGTDVAEHVDRLLRVQVVVDGDAGVHRLQVLRRGIAFALTLLQAHVHRVHGLGQRNLEVDAGLVHLLVGLAEGGLDAALAGRDHDDRAQGPQAEQHGAADEQGADEGLPRGAGIQVCHARVLSV